jgi:hypothetical protein
MKERLKRRQLSTVAGILVVVALLALMLIVMMISYVLADLFNLPALQYIEYVVFIIVGLLIIRYGLTEYEYTVVDDEFFVDRYIGKRARRLFSVKMGDVLSVETQPPDGCKRRPQRLTYKSKRHGVVYLTYRNGSDTRCMYFSPSEKMVDLINARRKTVKQQAQG